MVEADASLLAEWPRVGKQVESRGLAQPTGLGRIWRVQHREAAALPVPALDRRDLPALIRAMETSANAHVRQTAWRLARENHAGDARLAQVKRPMGSRALQTYEEARTAATPAARAAVFDAFTKAEDNWTRSALVAAASEQLPAYVAEALASPRAGALADFVSALLPSAVPAQRASLLAAAAAAAQGSTGRALALLEGSAMALRARVAALLAKLPHVDQRELHALGDELAGSDPAPLATFTEVVRDWLSARLDAPAGSLARLAQLARTWDKVNRAARDVETYNLERKPLVFSVFAWLAETGRH